MYECDIYDYCGARKYLVKWLSEEFSDLPPEEKAEGELTAAALADFWNRKATDEQKQKTPRWRQVLLRALEKELPKIKTQEPLEEGEYLARRLLAVADEPPCYLVQWAPTMIEVEDSEGGTEQVTEAHPDSFAYEICTLHGRR
jgi:hypothetical protein